MSVRPSVRRSVRRSVRPSHFFLFFAKWLIELRVRDLWRLALFSFFLSLSFFSFFLSVFLTFLFLFLSRKFHEGTPISIDLTSLWYSIPSFFFISEFPLLLIWDRFTNKYHLISFYEEILCKMFSL